MGGASITLIALRNFDRSYRPSPAPQTTPITFSLPNGNIKKNQFYIHPLEPNNLKNAQMALSLQQRCVHFHCKIPVLSN